MCGITGKFNFNHSKPVEPDQIQRMVQILNHRGPDDRGVFIDGRIGLGHARLSIIDLSPAGHQPMSIDACNSDGKSGKLWITFNGEIYNFLELREELETKGHRFHSRSDTEVILHLYEDEGVDCLKKLHGMFAFAIWDSSRERLFLARDRVGKKPLVYSIKNGSLTFASELKSILLDPDVTREIRPSAIHNYLTYQYIPSPDTAFTDIQKLPPAHYLVCEKGNVKIESYWDLSFREKGDFSFPEWEAEFRKRFISSVNQRMISDVPLGVLLSGGIDSGAVTATMARLSRNPVKTFSIGFEESDFNELHYARIIAQKYKTDHYEWVVKPDVLDILPKLVWHYGEPFADPSAIPTFYLTQMVGSHLKVVLNGDGGDEAFAGYERYLAGRLARTYGKIPSAIRDWIIRPLARGFQGGGTSRGLFRSFRRFVESYQPDLQAGHIGYNPYFDHDSKRSLYTKEYGRAMDDLNSIDLIRKWYQKADGADFLDQTLYVDTKTWLPDDLLVKTDIAGMAYGVELRSPFLDHQILEFAASLPVSYKLRGLKLKNFLKKVFEYELPPAILKRRKMGFGVPLEAWFKGPLRDLARDVLTSERSVKRGYFRPESLKRLYEEHQAGKIDHSSRIWALVMLEYWHRVYMDQQIPMSV